MPHKPSTHLDATKLTRNALRKRKITPPDGITLTQEERITFDNLASEFSLDEITDHKIELIVVAAKALALVAREQSLLATEGAVVSSPHGAKPNPRMTVISNTLASLMKVRRALGLGNARSLVDLATMRSQVKAQEQDVLRVLDDPLIN
jgi:hypothetical protein